MTTTYRRDTRLPAGGETAAHLVADLEAADVTIPAPVADAAGHLRRLRDRMRGVATDRAHRQATVDALTADPDADIADSVASELTASVERNALVQAIDVARRRLAAEVAANSDELTASVRDAIFGPAVEQLVATAAATATGDTVTSLARAGDLDRARMLADAEVAADRVAQARALRRRIYTGRSGIDNHPTSVWREPDVPDRRSLADLEGADRLLAGIRAGGELWLGTLAEVEDTARRARQAAEDAQAAAIEAQPVTPAKRSGRVSAA